MKTGPFLFDQNIPVFRLKKTPLFFEFDYTRMTILIFFKDKIMQMERNTIIEFLMTSEPDMDPGIATMSLMDLIDLLIDRVSETELDYSILSTAFINKVHPDRFEHFHEAVMGQYDMIRDGEEIPEPVLDRIATQYR